MKRVFFKTIQEVESLKNKLNNPSQLTYRYLKMKQQYVVFYPEELDKYTI